MYGFGFSFFGFVSNALDVILENALQYLQGFESPTTAVDKVEPLYPAQYVQNPCLTFDGVADYVDFLGATPSGVFSGRGRFYFDSAKTNTREIMTGGITTFAAGRIEKTAANVIKIGAGTDNAVTSSNSVIFDDWNYVEWYLDGTESSVTLNGTESTGVGATIVGDPVGFRLGTHTGESLHFGGVCCLFELDGFCVAPFTEKSGDTVHDVSTNGNDGTISETPDWSNTQDVFAYAAEYGFYAETAGVAPFIPARYDGSGYAANGLALTGQPLGTKYHHNNGPYNVIQDAANAGVLGHSMLWFEADGVTPISISFADLQAWVNLSDGSTVVNCIPINDVCHCTMAAIMPDGFL